MAGGDATVGRRRRQVFPHKHRQVHEAPFASLRNLA